MDPSIITEVGELLNAEIPPSRNRDFQRFQSTRGRQVLRLYRLYHKLALSLKDAEKRPEVKVRLAACEDDFLVEVKDPLQESVRSCRIPWELSGFFKDHLQKLGIKLKR
ncbi:hypothetical protein [Dethiosulfatarculus sandiegensis]|uniref:Uncharacterized protein n=1 Tax=Dethiosulfatarculus sandiegensis TaxID=1429043 RepID=A0A0D2J514_9BACT|nr:hypothetical protein [Dethiosulfatarculus sandiegensis]KIX10801.1 hypothetical protein X474_27905 [Dethiosulfatarculus sandiegensis]